MAAVVPAYFDSALGAVDEAAQWRSSGSSPDRQLRDRRELRSELAEVMIHVLVLSNPPFGARHASEEAVNIAVTAFLAQDVKLTQKRFHPVHGGAELRFTLNDEIRAGRRIPPEGFFTDKVFSKYPTDRLPDKRLFRSLLACRHFERPRGVLEHLRSAHLSPLALGVRLKRVDSAHDVLVCHSVEECSHGCRAQSLRAMVADAAGVGAASVSAIVAQLVPAAEIH